MAISYHIYANDGQGGDVDYSAPIATTAATTHAAGPLAAPSDTTFAVRAFDDVSGIEEANTTALARLVIDASGVDMTASPNRVVGLAARPTAGGTCRVSWGYDPKGQGGPPASFAVFLTPGPSAVFSNPAATVDYLPGVAGYVCSLSGLPDDQPVTVSVRAVGASSSLVGAPASVGVVARSAPLADVDALSAVATP